MRLCEASQGSAAVSGHDRSTNIDVHACRTPHATVCWSMHRYFSSARRETWQAKPTVTAGNWWRVVFIPIYHSARNPFHWRSHKFERNQRNTTDKKYYEDYSILHYTTALFVLCRLQLESFTELTVKISWS